MSLVIEGGYAWCAIPLDIVFMHLFNKIFELNWIEMVRGWSPSKSVSGSPDLQPTWSLLLKIKKGDEIKKKIHFWNYWANWN
jgi:hypothetical protein